MRECEVMGEDVARVPRTLAIWLPLLAYVPWRRATRSMVPVARFVLEYPCNAL